MDMSDLFNPNVERLKAKGDVKGLIKMLENKRERSARLGAANALGDIGDATAVEPLIQALKDKDCRDDALLAVTNALERMGDAAVEPLIQTLKDEDSSVRWNAATVLENLDWEPRGDAERLDYLVAMQRWDELVTLGAPGLEPAIQALNHESRFVRLAATHALEQTRDARAVEALIRVLRDDEDWYVRMSAAHTLGEIRDERAIESFIQALLEDEDSSVRGKAAMVLGKIGDERAVEALTQALKKEKNEFAWDNANEALSKLKKKKNEDVKQE